MFTLASEDMDVGTIDRTQPTDHLTGGLLLYVQLFFHDFQHNSGSQLEAVLKDKAVGYCLELADAIRIFLKQLLLFVRHGGAEFIFIPADQLLQLFILLARGGVVLRRLDISVPKFLEDSHTAFSP